ncbi:MAG: DUF4435 domain-containing protein, partial [Candidatus Aminicenantes bacterium]|nr:DUF4435 domain-containing protein [Candidatus Aminicenantes bacterium]
VRMTRSLHKGAILVVEGDTDSRVYDGFIDCSACMIIPSHGKDNAINALKILENEKYPGILAIIDADFWRIDGIKPDSVNLLLTDTHDLETMILSKSKALGKILGEFGSKYKISKFASPIDVALCKNALPIGFFRWISSETKDNLNLKFKGISFEKFVDETKLEINIDRLIAEVKRNSGDKNIDEKSITIKITSLMNENFDPWQICSGHDMVQVLAIGLRYIFGNKKAEPITAEILEGVLRITYEYSEFCLTGVYMAIREWENRNSPYKVLKT